MTAAVQFNSLRVQCFVLTVVTAVSSQQLTQGECPHCLLARCLSMCLRVCVCVCVCACERGLGPVISQIYYNSSVRRQAGVIRAGMGCEEAQPRSVPQVLLDVCVDECVRACV